MLHAYKKLNITTDNIMKHVLNLINSSSGRTVVDIICILCVCEINSYFKHLDAVLNTPFYKIQTINQIAYHIILST